MTEQQMMTISRVFDIFKPEDELIEVRTVTQPSKSGYFRNKTNLIKELQKYPNDTWYFIFNEIKDACYSREQCEKIMQKKVTTSDADIKGIRWLLVDCDPVRASGVSSTDEEKLEALKTCQRVYKFLHKKGFSLPIVADSGNGYHLLYSVNIPTIEKGDLVTIANFLKTLDSLFSDEKVKIDTAVGNPARLTKLYGTVAKKGANTKERPHRESCLLDVPKHVRDKMTPIALVEEVAKIYEKQNEQPKQNYTERLTDRSFDLRDFITKHNIKVNKESSFDGGTRFILDECVFDSSHKAPDSAILLRSNGVICYNCFHNSCQDKTWKDVRLMFEPDAYDKREQRPRSTKSSDVVMHSLIDENGDETQKPFYTLKEIKPKNRKQIVSIPTGFYELDKALEGGLNKGEFSIWSGGNGSGKSTVLSQIAVEGIDKGFKVALFSGELSADRVKNWLQLQAAGKRHTVNEYPSSNYYWVPSQIGEKIDEWAEGRLWIYNNDYGREVTKVLEQFKRHISEHETDMVVIDNLMSLDIREASKDKYEAQSLIALKMAELAKTNNIHLHFVCHPRKANGFLRKTDISGTADLTNSADNVFMVHRTNMDFAKLGKDFFDKNTIESCVEKYSNVIEIMKNRDIGVQDRLVGLLFEKESKRLLNYTNENKTYTWESALPSAWEKSEMPW